jgi:hypothetical protein
MNQLEQRLAKLERLVTPQSGPTPAQIEVAAHQFDKTFLRLCERSAAEIESDGLEGVIERVIASGSPASTLAFCEVLSVNEDDLRFDLLKGNRTTEWRQHTRGLLRDLIAHGDTPEGASP